MTAYRAIALLMLVGCDQIYGLDRTALEPGAKDTDGDTINDALDNCIAIPNLGQDDADADGKGDVCDNCTFLRNTDQSDVDHDTIGDACDPHPEDGGDCLILVDTFTDPAAFSQHWEILAEAGDTPEVTPGAGMVRLRPHPPSKVGIVARGEDGAVLGGVFDVTIRGSVTISTTGSIAAVSNASNVKSGYACSLRGPTGLAISSANGTSTSAYTAGLSSDPVLDVYVLRLTATTPTTQPYPDQCRVDYGVAVGVRTVTPMLRPTGGGAGVIADRDPTDVTAVALYQRRTPCPSPIVR